MKRRAFTLIELLVIIAVIGILAAILLPALARSKAVAKRIHCVGNVKQLALTAHLYADDNRDRLPSDRMPLNDHSFVLGFWDSTFYRYLGNKDVFQCAGNRLPNPPPQGLDPTGFNHSYGWNDFGLSGDSKSTMGRRFLRPSVKLGSVVSPSDCLALGDTAGWGFVFNIRFSSIDGSDHLDHLFWDARYNPPLFSPLPSGWLSRRLYIFHLTRRHYGNANVAFLDGHVKHGSLRDWTLPVEEVHRRWHYDNKAHLDKLRYRDADNWHPLRGIDEKIPND